MQRFEDKVVLVTGAANGIGQATAERMAAEGAQVVCTDVETEAVEATAKKIEAAGGRALARTSDISDPDSVEQVIADTLKEFGKLDALCNIAGIVHYDNTHELELARWTRILEVNLTGTFLMCQTALPHLLEAQGNIVNVASTAGLSGHPWMAAYASSKGGVLALTRTLAVEYARKGLRANAVCPGSIKTAMHDQFSLPEGGNMKLLERIMPLDKFRGPEQAASLVAFLASSDAAHINGEEVRVDGGTLA